MSEVYIQGIGHVVCIVPKGELLRRLPEKIIFSQNGMLGKTVTMSQDMCSG